MILALSLAGCADKTKHEEHPTAAPQTVNPSEGSATASPSESASPSDADSGSEVSPTPSSTLSPVDQANMKHPEYKTIKARGEAALEDMTDWRPAQDLSESEAVVRAGRDGYLSKKLMKSYAGVHNRPSDPRFWNWAANQGYSSFVDISVPQGVEMPSWDKQTYGMNVFPLYFQANISWGDKDNDDTGRTDTRSSRSYSLRMVKENGKWVVDSFAVNYYKAGPDPDTEEPDAN